MLGVKSLQSFSTGYRPHFVFARLKLQRRAGSKVEQIRLRSEEPERKCGEGLRLARAAAEEVDLQISFLWRKKKGGKKNKNKTTLEFLNSTFAG